MSASDVKAGAGVSFGWKEIPLLQAPVAPDCEVLVLYRGELTREAIDGLIEILNIVREKAARERREDEEVRYLSDAPIKEVLP